MKYGLIYSLNDRAGVGVAEVLRSLMPSRPTSLKGFAEAFILEDLDSVLAAVSCDITECEFVNELLDVKYLVMISKHFSNVGVKSFTTHHVGIPIHDLEAVRGVKGFPQSNPALAKSLLKNLRRFSEEFGLEDFVTSYEVTHHGPFTVSKPLTFVELGSSPAEWGLRKAQDVMAYSIINSLNADIKCVPTVGFGGNHYASMFTSRAFGGDECYGHIIPNYVLKYFKDDVDVVGRLVEYAVSSSSVPTARAVLDGKVPSKVRKLIVNYCSAVDLEVS